MKCSLRCCKLLFQTVTLRARVWVEIAISTLGLSHWMSPSVRGCGLKCGLHRSADSSPQSPSVRGCGLKFSIRPERPTCVIVTLRARVWVEITCRIGCTLAKTWVTLRARVWVEIPLPPFEYQRVVVTLRARVWVEMPLRSGGGCGCPCHPPCEGVG